MVDGTDSTGNRSGASGGPVLHTLSDLAGGDVDPAVRFARVDGLAFGAFNDDGYIDAKRRISDPDRFVVAVVDGVDAGCSGTFAFDLTLPGGAVVPVGGLGDVGVVTSHRRRGILRSMIGWLLDDSVRRGEVASTLTASEATIYGRFGFGVAVPVRGVEVLTARSRFRDDAPVADGSIRLHDVAADRAELLGLLPGLHRDSAANGALSRTDDWWSVVLGDAETYVGGHVGQRVIVHRGPDGTPGGYALFRSSERATDHGPEIVLDVREVVGRTVADQLAVWRALFDHDLVVAVRTALPRHHVLDDVMVDERAVRSRSLRDHLWLRPLDVAALLTARSYAADATLTVDVADAFRPGSGGTFRLSVDGGRGLCERTSTDAVDLVVGPAELGARVLGEGSFRALARAGRVTGTPDALARADAMFAADPVPWTDTRF